MLESKKERRTVPVWGRIGGETTPPSRDQHTAFLRMKQIGREGCSSILVGCPARVTVWGHQPLTDD